MAPVRAGSGLEEFVAGLTRSDADGSSWSEEPHPRGAVLPGGTEAADATGRRLGEPLGPGDAPAFPPGGPREPGRGRGQRPRSPGEALGEGTELGMTLHRGAGGAVAVAEAVMPFRWPAVDRRVVAALLASELRLVGGIGAVRAARLRSAGVRGLAELSAHRRYGRSAAEVLALLERSQVGEVHSLLRRRAPEHELAVLAGCPPSRMLVLDLETLGLGPESPVVLAGVGWLGCRTLRIRQYVVRRADEEPAALAATLGALGRARVWLTYNGRSADLPWLRQRAAYFSLLPLPERPHLDLLPLARKHVVAPLGLPDARLTTVQAALAAGHMPGPGEPAGSRPAGDLPGWAVPSAYQRWERTGDLQALRMILEHNRADLVALGRLAAALLSLTLCL